MTKSTKYFLVGQNPMNWLTGKVSRHLFEFFICYCHMSSVHEGSELKILRSYVIKIIRKIIMFGKTYLEISEPNLFFII